MGRDRRPGRRRDQARARHGAAAAARTLTSAALATLRPLAAVLVICTVVGLAGWLVQVARDVDGVRLGRSAPTALIEEAAFAGEDGIHLTALAAGARFTADADGPLGLPFPVAGAEDVPGRTAPSASSPTTTRSPPRSCSPRSCS